MIGILAVQGAFIEHAQMLNALGADHFEIRQRADLDGHALSALLLPGGESTVMEKLLRELDLFDPLAERIRSGMPVFGTCAGMILLAKQVINDTRTGFAAMDVVVRRNAYGRQLGSFSVSAPFQGIGEVPMVFIRAPYIERTLSPSIQVLAEVGGHIVAARQANMLATAFHPELSDDVRIHRYFLETMVYSGK